MAVESEFEVRNLGTRCTSKLRSLLGRWKEAQRAVPRLTFGAWNQRGVAALSDNELPDLRNIYRSDLDSLAAETHALLQNIPETKALINPFEILMHTAAQVSQQTAARSPKGCSRLVRDDSVDRPTCTLSSEQRKVLLLRLNEGLTYEQIAEKLEISPRRALTQLSRAYSAMRCQMDLAN